MDISDTLAPKSDQLDAAELVEPRTFEVERVTKGSAEQPVQVYLVGFPRPWRPGKSMRRVLAACWGKDASRWTGHCVRLYCDPEVVFGGEKVGGTRISHLSHIDGPQSVPLLVTRGKSAMYTVQPLADAAPQLRTQQQANELGAALKLLSLDDPTEALALMSGWVGRDLVSTKSLTTDECATVLGQLREMARQAEAQAEAADPEPGALFPEGDR